MSCGTAFYPSICAYITSFLHVVPTNKIRSTYSLVVKHQQQLFCRRQVRRLSIPSETMAGDACRDHEAQYFNTRKLLLLLNDTVFETVARIARIGTTRPPSRDAGVAIQVAYALRRIPSMIDRLAGVLWLISYMDYLFYKTPDELDEHAKQSRRKFSHSWYSTDSKRRWPAEKPSYNPYGVQ